GTTDHWEACASPAQRPRFPGFASGPAHEWRRSGRCDRLSDQRARLLRSGPGRDDLPGRGGRDHVFQSFRLRPPGRGVRHGNAAAYCWPRGLGGDRPDDRQRHPRGGPSRRNRGPRGDRRCARSRNHLAFCSTSHIRSLVMAFPTLRPRRLRRSEALRKLVRETRLGVQGLVYPMFVCPGSQVRAEVSSMPGVYQQSVDKLVEECREVEGLGIPGVSLIGLPEGKDERGSEAVRAEGVVPRAIEAISRAKLHLLVITDVCLCGYTSHGHCGVVKDGVVLNDPTVEILAEEALAHARAGADIVAPSDMMDGRVAAIRRKLDEHGFTDVAILSYAAKYCSGFYGPFREAAQ